jgi:hypothetical protein
MSEFRKPIAPVIMDGSPTAISDEELDAFETADDVVQTSDQEFQVSNHKKVTQGGASVSAAPAIAWQRSTRGFDAGCFGMRFASGPSPLAPIL